MSTPATYLGAPVPDAIREQWKRWAGAAWRQMQYRATNRPFPPDERFNVRPAAGICPAHYQHWLDYRNMRFDYYGTCDRWPGGPGSPFIIISPDLKRVREERRVEWDEKARGQMQLIERICLSGRSPQCHRDAQEPAVPQRAVT